MIKQYPDSKNALYWVKKIRNKYSNLREILTQRLVEKGILEEKKKKKKKKKYLVFSKIFIRRITGYFYFSPHLLLYSPSGL